MIISYVNLFGQTLRYIWNNKALWIFGIFAALFNTVDFASFINVSKTLTTLQNTWLFFTYDLPTYATLVFKAGPLAIVLSIILVLALVSITLGFLWFNLVSQATIIKNISLLDNGKNVPTFKENFKLNKKFVWNILGLMIATHIVVMILSVSMSLPKFAAVWFSLQGSSIVANVVIGIVGVIFLILSIFVFFTALYALNYIVLHKNSLRESVEKGLRLFSKNWIVSLETIFIIILISYGVSLVSSEIFKVYLVMKIVLQQLVVTSAGAVMFKLLTWLANCLFALFIGFFTAYQLAIWTTLFEQISKKDYKGFLQNLFSIESKA